MNGPGTEALRETHKAPRVPPLPSPEAELGTPTVTAFWNMQASVGNAALAGAGMPISDDGHWIWNGAAWQPTGK